MVATALINSAPESLRCRIVEIGDLQIYDEDLDDQPPESWTRFRKEISPAEAVLIVTPEYNRSIPACLKNALDVGSRPEGKNLWDGKPAGVVSVTPYRMGAFGANHHVRQTLVFLNMPAMQQPEAYIGGAADLFDDDGKLKSDDTRQFLIQFMIAFERWVATLLAGSMEDAFADFMKQQRSQIAAAYSNGDSGPLKRVVPRTGMATFFPPPGGAVVGAEKVAERYEEDAKSFSPDAKSKLDVLVSGTSSKLAYWAGFQEVEGRVHGRDAKMKLRVTEVFRLIEDKWKLIHRHADLAGDSSD
jgi:NAD(P)H-dependent FMN reductase/ketosteroid isomerase-like protein